MPDTAANEALAHRWHMEIFHEGKLEVADEILAPDFVFHMPGQDVEGAEGAKQLATELRRAFPEGPIVHEDTVAAGDKVAIRWTAHVRHQGEFLGIAATGAEVDLRGIDIFHLRDGKIAEAWIEWDLLGILQRIGAVPVLGQQTAQGES
jgi:steroid delta-isomerase-like uncharacterized protein